MALSAVVWRYARLWLVALLVPVFARVTAAFANGDPVVASFLSASTNRALTADALLYTAGAVLLFAPLAGVAVVGAGRARREDSPATGALETTWSLTVAMSMLVATSAALTVFGWRQSDIDALRLIATSHATMFAVALALSAFGALCGATLNDSLDAAGCSLSVVLVAAGWLLVAGASLANVPRAWLEVALTASPFVTMASAAHIDVMRMAVPYQMSPLAHLQVHYASWHLASGWYLAFAGLCFVAVNWQARSWQLTSVRLKGRIA